MNYYVDGDFSSTDFCFDIKDQLFSSIYSSNNSNYSFLEPDSVTHQNIVNKSFRNIASFYNNHESIFTDFNSLEGFNPWFLEHFRLYFNFRNFLLKIASIEVFLSQFPEGKIITRDSKIGDFIELDSILLVNKKEKKRIDLSLLFHELKKILFSKRKTFLKSDILLFESGRADFGRLYSDFSSFTSRNILEKRTYAEKSYDSDYILKKYFLNYNWLKDFINIKKSFNNLIKELRSKSYNSKYDKLIVDYFINHYKSQYLYFFRYKSFINFFKSISIKGIIVNDENSPQLKVIQYAAKLSKVKVFAYQHGTIHSLHPAYMYGYYNSKPLLADVTFLWGKYFEALLLKEGGYSKKSIFTCGKIQNQTTSSLNLSISKNKKVILFATQPQRDPFLREKQIKDVMLCVKEFSDDYQLVIRPHPNEICDDFFTKISKSINFSDYIIDRISDLHSNFDSCFLMITSFSTVGTEFIPHYKPMIILDYLSQDLIGYIKKGVGIQVKNRADLVNVLSSSISIDKEAYDSFIEDFFFKLDNKAEERMLKRINKEI
jgi:hypothetical protein